MASSRPASRAAARPKPVPLGAGADIVIVGGGMAGVMAALAAKQPENRVLLVEPSNVLGGQGTMGGVAGFCGDTERVNREFADLVARLDRHGFIAPYRPNDDRRAYDLEWCAFFLQEMVVARGVEVLLHSRVIRATADAGTVRQLAIATVGGVVELAPRFVIDASGACVIPVLTGFPVEHEGANRQLPMSLYFTLWDTGSPVAPVLPEGCPRWRHDDEIPMTSLHVFPTGKVEVKMKIVGFDAADGFDRSAAEIFGRRQMHALIYYLQTVGYKGTRLDRHVLASVSRAVGVREERRIVGEHVLTENEARRAVIFPDAVAVNTYHIDFHWPDRMERAGTGITDMLDPHHLPLRMMIPRGARNLLVPGRGASADQTAMSAFRVMAVVAQMGFAAGHAARLCVAEKTDLRGLDLVRLQDAIRAGGQSLDLSDYGNYLRYDLFNQEDVAPISESAKPHGAPSLAALSNGRFLAVWSTGRQLWWAERREKRWGAPQPLTVGSTVAGAQELRLERAASRRVQLTFLDSDGQGWLMDTPDEAIAWSVPERQEASSGPPALDVSGRRLTLVLRDLSTGREARIRIQEADRTHEWLGAPLAIAAGGQAAFTRLDDGFVAMAFCDPGEASQPGFAVALSNDEGRTWIARRTILATSEPQHRPAVVATRTGLAVLGVVGNRLTFWHGSPERILQGPPRASAHVLQA